MTPPTAQQFPAPDWSRIPGCPKVDRFLVGPELGRGGMGRVNLAWDPLLQRQVALKRIPGNDPEECLRFLREAKHQAGLNHPNICPIHEVGTDLEFPYIVMYFVEGQPLSELRTELSIEEVARIGAEVAGAVHSAHRANLVHRDLKPQNILVERAPEGTLKPWVVDFGLARDLTRADVTLTWAFSGTPAFMSPGQAAGEPPCIADDIFSLGATLYAVLSGVPPFEAATVVGLLEQQSRGEAKPLRQRLAHVPKDLNTIVMTCLAPEPDRRYPTAFELESDLRRFLAGEPIKARPCTFAYRLWRRTRKHKVLVSTVAMALLIIAGLFGWNLQAGRRAARQAELATRFGLEVKELENLMRLERLMPPHDLRPAEARLRQGADQIRSQMKQLGRLGFGPGHYALGRVHLVLNEDEAALKELEAAWAAGFRAPEAAYALVLARFRLFDRALKLAQTTHRTPASFDEARSQLQAKWGPSIEEAYRQSHGQRLEHPAFGEALMARLRGDNKLCIRKCQEAHQAIPWLIEARVLEVEAKRDEHFDLRSQAGQQVKCQQLQREIADNLGECLRLAPSDELVLGTAIREIGNQATQDSEHGQPTEAPFIQGESLYARALMLRPEEPTILLALGFMKVRHAILMLCFGKDPRPMLQAYLSQRPGADIQPGKDDPLALVYWMLGTAEFIHGADPTPSLDKACAMTNRDTPDWAEIKLVAARFRLARGQDPTHDLEEAWKAVRASQNRIGSDPYHDQLDSEAHSLMAQWQRRQGLNNQASIQSGLASVCRAHEKRPDIAYGWWDRALLEAFAAENSARQGNPFAPALARARAAAQKAFALRKDHYRSAWTLAQVAMIEAHLMKTQGQDPTQQLSEARSALVKGFRSNATNFMLHQAKAELELMAGRPQEAQKAARAGVASKPDAVDLWLALAQAHQAQTGASGGEHAELAQAALARAKALSPHWAGQTDSQPRMGTKSAGMLSK